MFNRILQTTFLLAANLGSIAAAQTGNTIGVVVREDGIQPGYTLFAPISATEETFLIDDLGRVVNRWESSSRVANSVYLTEDGDLIRTLNPGFGSPISAGGAGGKIERRNWDGELEWTFLYINNEYRLHHDIEILPNGNILAIAWEAKSSSEATAAGRIPGTYGDGLWPDKIIEIEPSGSSGGKIVWEWHAWDHLVQDRDPALPNYGDPADFPHRIDVNYRRGNSSDWMHCNGIDYSPELDQIVISSRSFSEIWIIDHSITTKEAAGPAGDLLYRWGNPRAYGRGTTADQQLFAQHDAKWIVPGRPGYPGITIFNNGNGRPGPNYSSVEEIMTPMLRGGSYDIEPGQPFQPASPTWSYIASEPTDFYSSFISGAERLDNGNTLICSGANGEFFEVRPDGSEAWRYITPFGDDGRLDQGDSPPPGSNIVFRAERYDLDFPGFEGRDLTPGPQIENYPACPGDLDYDRMIDSKDLGSLLVAWGSSDPAADINGDGTVGSDDMGLLLVGWGPCP